MILVAESLKFHDRPRFRTVLGVLILGVRAKLLEDLNVGQQMPDGDDDGVLEGHQRGRSQRRSQIFVTTASMRGAWQPADFFSPGQPPTQKARCAASAKALVSTQTSASMS